MADAKGVYEYIDDNGETKYVTTAEVSKNAALYRNIAGQIKDGKARLITGEEANEIISNGMTKKTPTIDLNKIKSDARSMFVIPESFSSEQEYNKLYGDIDNKIKELRAQVSNFKPGSLEQQQAQATLNELNAMRSEVIDLGKKSNITRVSTTANANDDPIQSPEAGAAKIDAVAQKLANGGTLTADEVETLRANGVDIAARVAELTGRNETELLDEWGLTNNPKPDPEYKPAERVTDTSKVTDIIGNKEQKAPSLFSDDGNDNNNSTENNGTQPQPQGDNNNNGDNNMADKDKDKDKGKGKGKGSNKLWDSYKSGGLDPYPTLKAVTDIISNNARMNLDRAALLTGGQRDLDAYKPIETETDKIRDKQVDERAQFGGITKAEALEAARNGDWDGVRKIAGMGGFSDQELSMFSGMNLPDDLQKLWSNKMRKDEAETESTETKTKQEKQALAKSYDDQIDLKRQQIDANNDLIRKLSGTDYEAIAEAANTLKGVYGQIATYTSGGGTADTKTNNPFSLSLSIMGQGGNMAFGDSTGKTTSTSSQSNVDELIKQHLDEIIQAANEHATLKGEVNDQVIELLQKRNTELRDEIAQLKQDKAKALGDKMYFGQDHEPIEKKDEEKKGEEETKE